jgi:NADH:ubiquinone reductase (H+-translocating)
MTRDKAPHILILGGGYVGMYTALGLQKKLRRDQARITVVDPRSYMTYQPFLPEAGAGSISPRHVVVPLRRVLPECRIVVGEAKRVDQARRVAVVCVVLCRLLAFDIARDVFTFVFSAHTILPTSMCRL